MLTKEMILQARDAVIEPVEVPEWGGRVYVRSMSGADRDSFELKMSEQKRDGTMQNIRAELAVRTVCTESGVPLFSRADVAKLGEKSATALDRVWKVAAKLNGIGGDEIRDAEKN